MNHEMIAAPAPANEWMNDSQKSLAFMLAVGLGIDAARLETEAEKILADDPDADRLVSIYRAAEKLARE